MLARCYDDGIGVAQLIWQDVIHDGIGAPEDDAQA